MQRADGVPRLGTQRIVNADDRREPSGDAEIQMRILRGQSREFFRVLLRDCAALVLKDEVRAADQDGLSVHHAGNAVRHNVLHLRMVFLVGQAALFRFLDHGVRHGVRVMLLQTRGKAQHLALVLAAEGHDLRNRRLRVGQRAGLVKDDRVGLGDGLQKAPALDGNMIAAALAHGRKHRDRHGQLERAGEIDHQNGQHLRDVPRQKICQRRSAQRIRHQPVGKTGGLVLRGGFQLLGFLDHFDDPVIAAAAHRLLHADDAFALLRDRPGVDIAARPLCHRHGFAGDGRLIDHRLALGDLSVQRDQAAGAHDDLVARLHVADGDKQLRIAGLAPDLVHVQRHGSGEIGDGLLVRPLLQNFAQPQHEHDGACRGEVAAHHRDRDCRRIEHGDRQLPMPERGQALLYVANGAV